MELTNLHYVIQTIFLYFQGKESVFASTLLFTEKYRLIYSTFDVSFRFPKVDVIHIWEVRFTWTRIYTQLCQNVRAEKKNGIRDFMANGKT